MRLALIASALVGIGLFVAIWLLPIADEIRSVRDAQDPGPAVEPPAEPLDERAPSAEDLQSVCRTAAPRRAERGSVEMDMLGKLLLLFIVAVPFILALCGCGPAKLSPRARCRERALEQIASDLATAIAREAEQRANGWGGDRRATAEADVARRLRDEFLRVEREGCGL